MVYWTWKSIPNDGFETGCPYYQLVAFLMERFLSQQTFLPFRSDIKYIVAFSPKSKKPKKNSNIPIVLSASRRTDLVCCYPDYLIERLKGYPPEKAHSVVIWTKNPMNMITAGALKEALSVYAQLYIQLTITGLGGSILEPRIPEWEEVVEMVPDILGLVKEPRRISWRFDPIVQAEIYGRKITNVNLFPLLAARVRKFGITTCRTSWVEPYKKVTRRMEKKGFHLIPYSINERMDQAKHLELIAEEIGMKIQYCSMDGFARSRCIDGNFLSELHPDGLMCSLRKAKGQRKLCGCTESLDIGWYSLKCCNGCLYCYAEPFVYDL